MPQFAFATEEETKPEEPAAGKQITPLQKKVNDMVKSVRSLVIKTDEDMAAAQNDLITVNLTIKEVHKEFDDNIAKANALHKGLTAQRGKYLNPLEDTKKIIGSKMGEHELKVEREQAKKEREATAKAEKVEQKRQAELRVEADNRQIRNAEHAEVMGDMESVDDILNSRPAVREEPLVVPEVVLAKPKLQGLSFQDVWCWKLKVKDDYSKIPIYLLTLDEPAINAMVKAQKARCRIPGIEVYKTKGTRQKT